MSFQKPTCTIGPRRTTRRNGITLTELLLVIAIIGITSSLSLMVLRGAEEDALKNRTKSQIERITRVMNEKLELNFYRVLPARFFSSDLNEIRDFQRRGVAELLLAEFPHDQFNADPANFPRNSSQPPGYNWNNFPVPQMLNRYNAYFTSQGAWTATNEQAECLYAILALNYASDGQRLVAILRDSEIDDTDDDGYPEVVDAFGDPVTFQLVDDANNPIDPENNPLDAQEYQFVITSVNLAGKLN